MQVRNERDDVHAPRSAPPSTPVSVEEIRSALGSVIDPELGVDIVSLGMVGDIDVAGDRVNISVKLTTRACPLRGRIGDDVTETVGRHPAVDTVTISFSEMDAAERADVMERARLHAQQRGPRPRLGNRCQVVAIGSGKGGVGKSSVTVNLAVSLANAGHTVGLLDADIWGFSVPQLLGMSGPLDAAHDPEAGRPLITPISAEFGTGQLRVVSTGFMVDETTALMWRGLMLNKAVEQFLTDVDWGDLDYLLIDLPPGTGDVQMGLARMLPDAALVIVTTPAKAAQTVAQRAADMARRSFLPVCGVIENMTDFTCEHGDHYPLFGSGGGRALADAIGVPLLAQIPLEPSVSAANDAGSPVALGDGRASEAFRELAAHLVDVLGSDEEPAIEGCTARLLDAIESAFDNDPAAEVADELSFENR